jgi:excisionase family DNA binding protein
MGQLFTTTEIAKLLRLQDWMIRRLFEDGTLPEPPRVGGRRLISQKYIGTIRRACEARRWIAEEATV